MHQTMTIRAPARYDRAAHARRYAEVARLMPQYEWDVHFEELAIIQSLKHERNAIVLAHNYQRPEVFHGIADVQGDSLALARAAATSDADVIVMCGVRFMAETAKLLAPDRTVLLPDDTAGCSLADSISPADIRALRERYPGRPVVCYVNTSAAVKAECDACCTSANVVRIVEGFGSEEVILVPDEYLAAYAARHARVRIVSWRGRCEVHERFTGDEVREYRGATGAYVLAHPECPVDVQAAADYVGSTAGMIRALQREQPERAMLITECSMSDNISSAFPRTQFLRPCNLCPHMQLNTLAKVRRCLEEMSPQVTVPRDIAQRAARAVRRMIDIEAQSLA
jgi:quinolinate synthase